MEELMHRVQRTVWSVRATRELRRVAEVCKCVRKGVVGRLNAAYCQVRGHEGLRKHTTGLWRRRLHKWLTILAS